MLCDCEGGGGVLLIDIGCFRGMSQSGMFASEERLDDEKLRLRLSEVRSDEFELLGVILEFPKLLDGRGTSQESSILLNKLVAVLEDDKTERRLFPCLVLGFSEFITAIAGFGMSQLSASKETEGVREGPGLLSRLFAFDDGNKSYKQTSPNFCGVMT